MKVLWAPWRMQYILGEKPEGCIFCVKPGERRDAENYILHRGRTCFVIMNIFPYNNGHLMIAPYRHVPSLVDLNDEELLELMKVLNLSLRALEDALNPHGFNIGVNLGKVAGAGVEDHVHIHVVPRWHGDTNFMPILAETKVMPQHLRETYGKLKESFDKLAESGAR